MNRFFVLLGRELKTYFHSPIAYVVLFFFLLITGFNFYATVSILNRGPTQVTVIEAFFNTLLFWFAFILPFPLITMRTFADEFRMGTIEPLMTAPVRDLEVVLAKYLGALCFYILLWIPSLLYFVVFGLVTRGPAASAAGAYWGTYLLLLLLGMFYVAIGCLASCLTRNQIIAAVISFCSILLLFFSGLLSFIVLNMNPAIRDLLGYFSAIEHMSEFSKGVIDSRALVWYPTITAFVLAVTFQVFQFRKWRA